MIEEESIYPIYGTYVCWVLWYSGFMNLLQKFYSLKQVLRMLRLGYVPTRWSVSGNDIALASGFWVCNGAGCYERPEDAVGSATDLGAEIWKSIYLNKRYLSVSSFGRVRDENGDEFPVEADRKDYPYILVASEGRRKISYRAYPIHQLVAKLFCPNESSLDELSVHHLNGNRYDNRAANLICLSQQEHNLLHDGQQDNGFSLEEMYKKGRSELRESVSGQFRLTIRQLDSEWREIPDYEGLYWVNRNGLVISSSHKAIVGYQEPGHQFVNLKNEDGEITKHAVDQLVAVTWLEPPDSLGSFLDFSKGHIRHKNGDLSDSHLDNLQWINHVI